MDMLDTRALPGVPVLGDASGATRDDGLQAATSMPVPWVWRANEPAARYGRGPSGCPASNDEESGGWKAIALATAAVPARYQVAAAAAA
jgi:hypothetical protein